jgi:hypothetical protein
MSFRRLVISTCCSSLLVFALLVRLFAAPAPGTRLLRSPTVSATQIAFAYANNI